jgi:hypothetical protein
MNATKEFTGLTGLKNRTYVTVEIPVPPEELPQPVEPTEMVVEMVPNGEGGFTEVISR